MISLKIKGFSVEEHTCSECLQYQIVTGNIPICKKKLMTVTENLHVTYEDRKGTCFEPKS